MMQTRKETHADRREKKQKEIDKNVRHSSIRVLGLEIFPFQHFLNFI